MAGTLTIKSLRDFARNSLGEGFVEVELTDTHIDTAISRAVNMLNAYVPRRVFGLLPNQNGGRYLFTDTANPPVGVVYIPGLQDILDVVGVRASLFSTPDNRVDLMDPLLYVAGLGGGSTGRLNVVGFRQTTEYIDTIRDQFGSGLTWQSNGWLYDQTLDRRVYEIYVDIRSTTRMTFGYEANIAITADDDIRTGVWSIPLGMKDWTERYVLAGAKQILARVRGKFQGIPSPDGIDMTLDQNELAADGKEEMALLDAEIRAYRKHLPIIIG